MKWLFVLSMIFASLTSQAQNLIDCSGNWHGTSSFIKTTYHASIEISQNGSQLEGFVLIKTMNNRDSSKMAFKGSIHGNTIKIHENAFIYKAGLACLSNLVLEYSKRDGEEMLKGIWKGDWSLSTCAPSLRGEMLLYKEKKEALITQTNASDRSLVAVDQNDRIGNVLVDELKKRKYYALLIGVNDYKNDEIQSLDNPISDGKRLGNVLTEHYSFDKEDMIILENPERAEIIETLDLLSEKVTEKDNLLVFYAGHGVWNKQLNQGYWLPSDASMDSKSYWLSNSTIRDYIGGIKSKHSLLISDACFSGGILKERAVFENSRAMLELYKMPSRKAMTSGTLTTVPDKSVFIDYLVKNLEENQEVLLSADHLFRNFKIAVINNSPNGQVPQYGPITQTGDEGGEFIFLRK